MESIFGGYGNIVDSPVDADRDMIRRLCFWFFLIESDVEEDLVAFDEEFR
jgi:hypothetical protein